MKCYLVVMVLFFSHISFAADDDTKALQLDNSSPYQRAPDSISTQGGQKQKQIKKERPDLDRGVNTGSPTEGGINNDLEKNLKPENE